MLRASSLGLTFTHGIACYTPCQRSQFLHQQAGHEVLSFGKHCLRLYPTNKKEGQMGQKVPLVKKASLVKDPRASLATRKSSIPTSKRRRAIIDSFPHAPPLRRPRVTERTMTPTSKPARRDPSLALPRTDSSQSFKQRASCIKPPPDEPFPKGSASMILRRRVFQEHLRRQTLYAKLIDAADPDVAWNIYQELLQNCPPYIKQRIPHKYLHGFASQLQARENWVPSNKRRSQTIFLRLLSVLSTIYYTGGQVRLWEWNALIEFSARAWRGTSVQDFHSAINVHRDMIENRAPGASLTDNAYSPLHDETRIAQQPVAPDIVTYNTLLAIAARTRNDALLRQAESMLLSSGLSPTHVTHLTYLRYYARRGQLSGVRMTLSRMSLNGFRLDMAAINACLWAYGRNGRLDIAGLLYRILRHRVVPDDLIEDAVRELHELENITVPDGLRPDAVTYYTLIQAYAYRGRLRESLDVFTDMMRSPQRLTGRLEDVNMDVPQPEVPNPVLPIFRSIFLGFARHATPPGHIHYASALVPHGEHYPKEWTLEQLHTLFEHFIDLSDDARPNARTVYWLLVSFAILSGYDRAILRKVWEKLVARYGDRWGGRVRELQHKIYQEDFDKGYFEALRTNQNRQRVS